MERWVLTLTQLLLPAAEETGAHAGGGPHGVDLMHADGVGGADNGGDVMRFVHLLGQTVKSGCRVASISQIRA